MSIRYPSLNGVLRSGRAVLAAATGRAATLKSVILTYAAIAFRTCLPVVTMPLLFHRLGAHEFGIALTVQSLALLGSILTAYGFQNAGTREIGVSRSVNEREAVVSRIVSAQIMLSAATAVVIFIAANLTPGIRQSADLILLTILMATTLGFAPIWYFQGRGRSPLGLALDASGQLFTLVSVFLLIWSPADVILAITLMLSGQALTLLLGGFFIFRDGIRHVRFSLSAGWGAVRQGFHLFVARASSASYTVSGVWIVSIMSTPVQAGYYGVAAKIGSALLLSFAPLSYVAMPRAAKIAVDAPGQVLNHALKWTALIVTLAVATFVVIEVFADWFISELFEPNMNNAVTATKLLAATLIPNAFGQVLGSLILLPFRRDSRISTAIIIGAAVNITLAVLLVPKFGAVGMAISRVATETVITFVMIIMVTLTIRQHK